MKYFVGFFFCLNVLESIGPQKNVDQFIAKLSEVRIKELELLRRENRILRAMKTMRDKK